MREIKLYWCRGEGRSDPNKRNFGDYLSPLIVEILSGRRVVYAPVHQADLMAIGSILGREAKAKLWGVFPRRLHVWGAGTGSDGAKFSGRHYYHAVRGALTLDQISKPAGSPVLGDPGLLAPLVLGDKWRSNAKKTRVGVIPHYADQSEPALAELVSSIPGARLIDVYSPVKDVLKEISSCDLVLSSSMHGLIVADSFGIPNKWLIISRGRVSEYKFHDYYSAFGIYGERPLLPKDVIFSKMAWVDDVVSRYSRPGIDEVQNRLAKAFPYM